MSTALIVLAAVAVIAAATAVILRGPGGKHPRRRSRSDRIADLETENAADEEFWARVKATFPENATDYTVIPPREEYL
jgi:hypothetical protein